MFDVDFAVFIGDGGLDGVGDRGRLWGGLFGDVLALDESGQVSSVLLQGGFVDVLSALIAKQGDFSVGCQLQDVLVAGAGQSEIEEF